MAKKKGKSKRARSAAQKAATKKMLRAAKRARMAKKSAKVKSPRRRARVAKKATAPKRRRRRAAKAAAAPKRRRRKAARKASRKKTRTVKQPIVKTVPAGAVVMIAPKKHRRRKGGKKRRHAAKKGHRKGHRKGKKGSRRHKGAMENPLSGAELFVGSLFGVIGFGLGDLTDRFLATHPLTDKGTKDAGGHELFADNPPTTGSYAGLFNATAICAPMDAARWAVGLLVPAAGFGIAHFVGAPMVRSSMQFAAFGWGVRIVGKGLIDGVSMLTQTTPIGQRLYDGEMRAMALKSGGATNPVLASLPSAGLGKPALGAGDCKPCAERGMGYPSMPREVATQQPATATAPTPAPAAPPVPQFIPPTTSQLTPPTTSNFQPPPPPAAPPAPPVANTTLTGVPNGAKFNPYNWGYKGE